MLKFTCRFLSRVLHSRLGLLSACLHLCLVIYSFSLKEPWQIECHQEVNFAGTSLIAGRGVHLHYETALLKTLILLDLPGMLLAVPIGPLLWMLNYFLPEMCVTTKSWIAAAILLCTTSLQWCCIGYWMEHWWKTRKSIQR